MWTEDRLTYLKENAPKFAASDLAAALDLTEKQIRAALSYYKIPGRGVKGRVQDEAERLARGAGKRGLRSYQAGDLISCSACGAECPVYLDPQGRVQSLYCMRCKALVRYKLNANTFDALLATQDGKCALCPSTNEGKQWHVEHDHSCCNFSGSCGKCIRGIVCAKHNRDLHAIEEFLKNPEYQAVVLAYLS